MVSIVGDCTGNSRVSHTDDIMVEGGVAANPHHSPLVDEQTFKKMWNELETTTSTVSLSLEDSFESSTMWTVGEWQKGISSNVRDVHTQKRQVDDTTAWSPDWDDDDAFPEPTVLFPDDINELLPTQKKEEKEREEVQPIQKENTSCGGGDGFTVAAKSLSQMLVESNLFAKKNAPVAETSPLVSPSKLHHRRNSSGVIIMDDKSCELSLPYTNQDIADGDDNDDETVTTFNTTNTKSKCKLGTCGQNYASSSFCLKNINTGIDVVDSVIKGLCTEIGCAATDLFNYDNGIHGGGRDDISAFDSVTTATTLDNIQRRIERTTFREDIHVEENNSDQGMDSSGGRRSKTLQVMETVVYFSPPKEDDMNDSGSKSGTSILL